MSVDFSYCFGRPLFISHVVFNRPSPLPFVVILRIIIGIIRVGKPLSATLSINFTILVRGARQILALWPKLTNIQGSLLSHHAKSFLLHLCNLSSIIPIAPISVGHLCASSAVCVLVYWPVYHSRLHVFALVMKLRNRNQIQRPARYQQVVALFRLNSHAGL